MYFCAVLSFSIPYSIINIKNSASMDCLIKAIKMKTMFCMMYSRWPELLQNMISSSPNYFCAQSQLLLIIISPTCSIDNPKVPCKHFQDSKQCYSQEFWTSNNPTSLLSWQQSRRPHGYSLQQHRQDLHIDLLKENKSRNHIL